MPWFKVDDQLHSHPKPRRASLAALGLWTLSGSYSMAYKLDGFVPAWYVHGHNQGKRHAESLVRVGLWEKAVRKDEEGYLFHDWVALTVARAQARALLTSTDPAVHSALLDALVRAGVLTEDRERLVRACGCIANEEPAACCDPLASPHWERRLVTPWEVAP